VADAPVRPLAPTNGAGDALPAGDVPDFPPPTTGNAPPSPVAIPSDVGLPCGGQVIAELKPAQLAMLVSKTARLVQDQGGRWVPLLHALQAERAARLAKGRKVPAPAHGEG